MDFDFTLDSIIPDVGTSITVGSTGALALPTGTTSQRPTATVGMIRWNTTIPQLEYYNGSTWIAPTGTVTSISGSGGTTGLTLTGGPITTSGTLTLGGTLITANGGTGLTSIGTASQVLGVNTGATALEYKTITAGGGIVVTPATGAITISTRNSAAPTSVIYVSKTGNDTTGNGSWDNPFLTVTKGVTVAATLANSTNQVTVFIINGIYNETNPIAISNENILVQGQDIGSVFILPTTNGQPLFNLSSGTAGKGPTLNYLTVQGPAGYSAVSGGSLVRVSGDGYFELVQVYIDTGYTGIDCGNGTISAGQIVEWTGGDADNNNITVNVASSAQFWSENTTIRTSTTTAIQAAGTSAVTLNGFLLQGNLTTPVGTGISLSGSATLLATSGQIKGFVTGLLAAGTSNSRVLSGYFSSNTYDFNQSTSTAVVQIQGVYSATNPLITNGSNVSLNYIDSGTNDFIVGSAVSTGNPGKTFRVRDYDGRVAIGDNSTNANIASGPATPSGSRSLNLIDTNGNMRIWRFINTAGYDPSFELIKGINPANVDSDGQAPIVSIATGTNTITIDVSGSNFNPPLSTPPGIDRSTLAGRAFPAGRIFQVNGTVANNGTFTVSSATYNSGTQQIAIVVTATITTAGGAVGTVVFGGGAGRLDGPNPGNASAANIAGTGNVWWDTFLQESDYMVFRRRTGGGGSLTNEKVRIYPDHSEWLGASTYSDSDNALIFTAQNTASAVNYLTLQNSVTTNPVLINAAGTDTNVSISLVPKGTGVVTAGGTSGLVAPTGTTAQQPGTPVNGTIRYNSTTSLMEFRQNGAWINIGSGTVTSVSSSSTTGLTLTTTNPTTTPAIALAGTLNITNGGTGQTTASAAFNALSPTTAIGDMIYSNTVTNDTRLAIGSTGQVLTVVAGVPAWAAPATNGTVTSVSTSSTVSGLTLTTTTPTTTPAIVLAGTVGLTSGGTNANLTAVNGAVVYSTASALALTAAGTSGQVLTSTGAGAPVWSSTTGSSYATTVTPNTLVSGNYYSATITHNLGTYNVVVSVYDNSTEQLIIPQSIQQTSTNAILLTGVGNTRTYRVVVIANGAYISNASTTPLIIQNQGTSIGGGPYTTLNFVGTTLTATGAGSVATITDSSVSIPIRTLSYYATSLDSPNNADWALNTLAPTISDPANNAITVRQFTNTANSGVGLILPIPTGATNISFTYQGRSQTAATGNLQFQFYSRTIVNATTPAAPSAWSTANLLTSQAIASNVFYYTYTYTATLASLSLTTGNTYQIEFVRNTGVSGNLAQPWLLQGLTVTFT